LSLLEGCWVAILSLEESMQRKMVERFELGLTVW